MNIKDVRIGNYLPLKDYLPTIAPMHEAVTDFVTVITIRERTNMIHWTSKTRIANVNSGYNADEIEGIPLTEAWLIKLGFEATGVWGDYANEKLLICSGPKDDGSQLLDSHEYYFSYGNKRRSQQIKYVHQLQNLHFSITGEELTVK